MPTNLASGFLILASNTSLRGGGAAVIASGVKRSAAISGNP